MGLPALASIGFAESVPDTMVERGVHRFLLPDTIVMILSFTQVPMPRLLFLPLARFLKLLRYFESFRRLALFSFCSMHAGCLSS